MSTAVQSPRRPARPAAVLRLQLANPMRFLVMPLGILVVVVVLLIIVTIAVGRAHGITGGPDRNGAVVWSLLGFIFSLGVQGVAVCFPFALALGSTRRTFVLGTLAASLLLSVMLSAASLVLLGLELVTNGWLVGARVLSDATLGGGNPLVLAGVMFLTVFSAVSLGGAFGAIFVRFGALGPLLLAVAIALAVSVALLLFLPGLDAGAQAFRPWWLGVGAVVVVAMCVTAQYLLLRRASVR